METIFVNLDGVSGQVEGDFRPSFIEDIRKGVVEGIFIKGDGEPKRESLPLPASHANHKLSFVAEFLHQRRLWK